MSANDENMFASVAEAFAQNAVKFQSRPALLSLVSESSPKSISYGKLFAVCSQAAGRWFRHGQIVVVGIDEGPDLVAVELAAWLGGAAVCPFAVRDDPRAPDVISRLEPDWIVVANDAPEDQTSQKLKTHAKLAKASDILDWSIDEHAHSDSSSSKHYGDSGSWLSHLVFTSGTTGRPKCVGVKNSSLITFAHAKTARSKINDSSRLFMASAFTFDPQLGDLASSILAGACLVLPSRKSLLGGRMGRLLNDSKATHVCTTPAALSMIPDFVPSKDLQEVLVGGEKMPPTLVERLLEVFERTGTNLVNTYGVTECCVYQATKTICRVGQEHLLGDSYDGISLDLVVLDENDHIVRKCIIGEEGDLVMSGPLAGIGYLAETPISESGVQQKRPRAETVHFERTLGFVPGEAFYKTGDIGKYTTTGEIHFLGRKDSQFKINGIRIEAGEVEFALERQCDNIFTRAIACNVDSKLVAFVVMNPLDLGKIMTKEDVQCMRAPSCVVVCANRHLLRHLPIAYIPSAYYLIRRVPLAPTGKVDRKLLTALIHALDNASSAAVDVIDHGSTLNVDDEVEALLKSRVDDLTSPGFTILERFLAQVWGDILGLPSVDLADSFRDLGGDSLQALRAVNAVLSKIRDSYADQDHAEMDKNLAKAMDEAQRFGEIDGPFSAAVLIASPSLRQYAMSLAPLLKGIDTFNDKEEMQQKPLPSSIDFCGNDDDPALLRALSDASKLGLVQTVRSILSTKIVSADGRFIPRSRMCRTPLHEAAQSGQFDVIRVLAGEFGGRVMCVTEARLSPLHIALDAPTLLELCRWARHQRSDVRPIVVEDKNQQTPLHYFARAGKTDLIVELVNEQMAQPMQQDKFGNDELVKRALNAFDKWRRTPLHWAVVNGHFGTAKALLDLGAVVLRLGLKAGRRGPNTHLIQETPLQLARRRQASSDLIELLERAEIAERAVHDK